MMESSMKSISRPVIDRLPVNSLDEFACRQLDRVRNFPFLIFVFLCRFYFIFLVLSLFFILLLSLSLSQLLGSSNVMVL